MFILIVWFLTAVSAMVNLAPNDWNAEIFLVSWFVVLFLYKKWFKKGISKTLKIFKKIGDKFDEDMDTISRLF